MKTNFFSSTRRQGNILLTTLITTGMIGFALAAYLTMVSSQNRTIRASMAWNTSLGLVEAGIEEAMAHINENGLTNLVQDGWMLAGPDVYTITRALGVNYYTVVISNTTSVPRSPVIVSSGYVPTRLAGMPEPLFFATVGNDYGLTSGKYVHRSVMVTAYADSMFPAGLVAKDTISWVGNIYSDSFDSTDPAHSTNRRYDPTKRKDGGSIGANNGDISMGGGKVYGTVNTGPNSKVSNGTVGDFSWISSNTGIQPGHYLNNMNYTFSEVKPPFTASDPVSTSMPPGGNPVIATNLILTTNTIAGALNVPPGANAIATNTYTISAVYPTGTAYPVTVTNICTGSGKKQTCATNYIHTSFTYRTNSVIQQYIYDTIDYCAIFNGGNYELNSFSLSGQCRVLILGNTKIYVKGSFDMTGQSKIIIAGGAKLDVYLGGDAFIGGNGVANNNADSTMCSFWGLNSCKEIDFGGNASFTGTIYAPEAHYKAGGGGSDQYDIVGSAVVKSVGMNGHFSFHYDEALGKTAAADIYKISSWKEINATSW